MIEYYSSTCTSGRVFGGRYRLQNQKRVRKGKRGMKEGEGREENGREQESTNKMAFISNNSL